MARDIHWYLRDNCFYESLEAPRIFEPASNRHLEIWSFPNGQTEIVDKKVKPNDIGAWLHGDPPAKDSQQPSSGLRIIISTVDASCSMPLAFNFEKDDLTRIMTAFNLPLPYLEGHQFTFGSYGAYKGAHLAGSASPLQIGFVLAPPERRGDAIDATFTFDASSNISSGIVRVSCQEVFETFMDLLKVSDVSHPLALHDCILEMLVHSVHGYVFHGTQDVPHVHLPTGRVGGDLPIEAEVHDSKINFETLTRELSRSSQRMGHLVLIAKSARKLCTFLHESIEEVEPLICENSLTRDTNGVSSESRRLMVRNWSSRLDHLRDRLDDCTKMCTDQGQTVFNMIAQRDMQQNIELAKDSKTIAAASKRDSSAMKLIAFLTMTVLPGAFVSGLFSLPLFDWEAERWHQIAKPRFWFYWIITAPFTALTVSICLIWQKYYERHAIALDKQARIPSTNPSCYVPAGYLPRITMAFR